MRTIKAGAEGLPARFTSEERYAYQWLHDCQIRGWMVDLLKKSVTYVDENDILHHHKSLIEFAKVQGMEQPAPVTQPTTTTKGE